MKILFRSLAILACGAIAGGAGAQSVMTPRKSSPGNGPYEVPQATFFVHRLGIDHAEGITSSI